MAHKCPRCGEAVHRGYSGTAQAAAGLIGALFYAAFGPFECKRCGKIPFGDFPPETRKSIILMSTVMVIGAIGLVIGLIFLIGNTN